MLLCIAAAKIRSQTAKMMGERIGFGAGEPVASDQGRQLFGVLRKKSAFQEGHKTDSDEKGSKDPTTHP